MSSRRQVSFPRAVLVWCVLVCLLAPLPAVARRVSGDEVSVSTATREGRLRVFEEVWEQVRVRYYDPSLHGVDWGALGETFRPLAAGARDQTEFYSVLRRMLGHLRDPHTRVFAPGESPDWRVQRFVTVGVTVREIEGAAVVTSVERGSEAERAGVRAGDTVLSLDGETVEALVKRRLSEQTSAPTPSSRLLAVARLFDGPRDTQVTAVFRGGGSTARDKRVRLRRQVQTRTPSLQVLGAGRGVYVVRFNIFTWEIAGQVARALKGELRDARALVIDLRDNGGGETEAMADIASLFLPAGKSLGRFSDREGRILVEPHTRAALNSTAERPKTFSGPVAVLTGARTASASEVFVAALREANRATAVLGEGTCGCVLGIRRRHQLPDGGVLDVSEMDYRTAGGRRLEGVRLEPDEEINLTRLDLQRGRDRAVERAVQLLKTGDTSRSYRP
ncbi:MAG TPA: S41 family peptidase [Pyrinomonadaceae bacterium]|nr:S41 family peptidase [Pyrinomonadaceae bacterium]